MLRVVTAASSTFLLDPAATTARLGLAPGDQPTVEGWLEVARFAIEGFVGYPLPLQEYAQGFFGVTSQNLLLEPRPLVSVSSVQAPDDTDPLVLALGTECLVDYADHLIYRRQGWQNRMVSDLWAWPSIFQDANPDWLVQFLAGWWLPGMAGTRPAGAKDLDADLALGVYLAVLDMKQGDAIPARLKQTGKSGATAIFQGQGVELPERTKSIFRRVRRQAAGS